jgi:hypothetical protein
MMKWVSELERGRIGLSRKWTPNTLAITGGYHELMRPLEVPAAGAGTSALTDLGTIILER